MDPTLSAAVDTAVGTWAVVAMVVAAAGAGVYDTGLCWDAGGC